MGRKVSNSRSSPWIVARCPTCDARYRLASGKARQDVRCPKCTAALVVEAKSGARTPSEELSYKVRPPEPVTSRAGDSLKSARPPWVAPDTSRFQVVPRHSPEGIASFTLGIACGLASVILGIIVAASQTAAPGVFGSFGAPSIIESFLVSWATFICGLLNVLGISLAVFDLQRPDCRRFFLVAAICLNALGIVCVLFLVFVLGVPLPDIWLM